MGSRLLTSRSQGQAASDASLSDSSDSVERVVETILRRDCGVTGPLAPEARLAEDLGLDSLRLLTLVVELENHFRLTMEEDPEEPPASVGALTDLVRARLEAEGRG